MSSTKRPDDPKTSFMDDWYQRMTDAIKTHGTKWRTQFTPEELQFIEAAIDAECRWVSHANKHDVPGPSRFGEMDD